jgi:choline transport protein
MWWSYLVNAFMGTIMLITMLFCIGDLDTAIDSDAPYLILFTNTGSTSVALLLSVVLFILIFSGNVTALVTTSREIWAFSRDRGFPCSKWIAKVSPNAFNQYLMRKY